MSNTCLYNLQKEQVFYENINGIKYKYKKLSYGISIGKTISLNVIITYLHFMSLRCIFHQEF